MATVFTRGDSFDLEVCLEDDAGVAVDLTGYSAAAQIRKVATPYADGELVADLTVAIADQVAERGVVRLSAAPALTRLWPVGPLDLDVEFTSPTGFVFTAPSEGPIRISIRRDVTHVGP